MLKHLRTPALFMLGFAAAFALPDVAVPRWAVLLGAFVGGWLAHAAVVEVLSGIGRWLITCALGKKTMLALLAKAIERTPG